MCGAVCAADHVTAFRWGRLRQRVWELDFERLNGDGTAARKLPDPPCSLKRCGTQCMLSVVCRNSILIKGYESMRSEHARGEHGLRHMRLSAKTRRTCMWATSVCVVKASRKLGHSDFLSSLC